MASEMRGEIHAILDGRTWTLCLTLGALHEVEGILGVCGLDEIAGALAKNNMPAIHIASVITAALNGAGNEVNRDQVARMACNGGATGFADIIERLRQATFPGTSPITGPRQAGAIIPISAHALEAAE